MVMRCCSCPASRGGAKRTICFFCIVVVAGIVMWIVGLVVIAAPNDRAEQVAAYNAAIQAFNTSVTRNWTGRLNSTSEFQELNRRIFSINISDNAEGVSAGQASIMQANMVSMPNTITIAMNVLAISFDVSPQWFQTPIDVPLGCSPSYCSVNCESHTFYYCNARSMSNRCRDLYNGTWMGEGCTGSSTSCGSCRQLNFLQSYCVVITQQLSSNGLYAQSSEYQSCEYPFTASSQTYGTTAPMFGVPFEVYTDKDPYLVLQQQTKGTNAFGVTRAEQRHAGLSLIIIGGILSTGGGVMVVYVANHWFMCTDILKFFQPILSMFAEVHHRLFGPEQPYVHLDSPKKETDDKEKDKVEENGGETAEIWGGLLQVIL